uniref:Peptide-methionine (R)-S-oxide reductase n=1 Tax=Arion vulgaris TaxID=1028688 RepID=A0A0B7BCQ6_9EUPU
MSEPLIAATVTDRPGKINLSEDELKVKLEPEEFSVTREAATELPWTGKLLANEDSGKYTCICCGTELFSSSAKFDSGTGWPSFFKALPDRDVADLYAVGTRPDTSKGKIRTEVLCGKCDSHLGHVYTDGPQPTGIRYCINSVSLKFNPE